MGTRSKERAVSPILDWGKDGNPVMLNNGPTDHGSRINRIPLVRTAHVEILSVESPSRSRQFLIKSNVRWFSFVIKSLELGIENSSHLLIIIFKKYMYNCASISLSCNEPRKSTSLLVWKKIGLNAFYSLGPSVESHRGQADSARAGCVGAIARGRNGRLWLLPRSHRRPNLCQMQNSRGSFVLF